MSNAVVKGHPTRNHQNAYFLLQSNIDLDLERVNRTVGNRQKRPSSPWSSAFAISIIVEDVSQLDKKPGFSK
jgi:hypothetical protein